jgi:hypothetical protein
MRTLRDAAVYIRELNIRNLSIRQRIDITPNNISIEIADIKNDKMYYCAVSWNCINEAKTNPIIAAIDNIYEKHINNSLY